MSRNTTVHLYYHSSSILFANLKTLYFHIRTKILLSCPGQFLILKSKIRSSLYSLPHISFEVIALKAHLISPACYRFFQSLNCIILPTTSLIRALSPCIGLDSEYLHLLNKLTADLCKRDRYVVLNMDEIHVSRQLFLIKVITGDILHSVNACYNIIRTVEFAY